ncbi:MAG: DUF1015 domain-containing protein [Planctomycetes bacterium]|nr:DUF1015 domain-containing protein [Planctomycetota bacterium]
MAKVFPFRGYIYNKKKMKDYGLVLTQPYDKIDERQQNVYYGKSKYNIVRVIKGKELKGDREGNNKYTRAARFLNDWIKKKVVVQDKKPAIYAYNQSYSDNGIWRTRRGFIALGRLAGFGSGGVHAHERTLLKPKQDRLNLMRQVGGTAGQIFMLYSDPEGQTNKVLDSATGRKKADFEARDEYGEVHRIWKITQPNLIKKIAQVMARKDIFIADGHHRYETAVNYRNEMAKQKKKCQGTESYLNRMMTFINMDAAGLTIFPTHRLVFGLKKFSFKKLEKKLAPHFYIDEFSFSGPSGEKIARRELVAALRAGRYGSHCFGLMVKGVKKYFLLTLKDEKVMDRVIKEKHSSIWKRLDVTILHSFILDGMLGITKKKLERQTNVRHARHIDYAAKEVRRGKFQLAFLLNSTKMNEVKNVAASGERMPQKSTDFYPKLLSGIVISKINFKK